MEALIYKGFAVSFILVFLAACQSQSTSRVINSVPPDDSVGKLQICSPLDFSQVSWPASLSTDEDRNALELALNISGSFEGAQGWANLTNNFDGQGMSMGLLNQNLGQGTLQPLLIKMRDQYTNRLNQIFSADHLQSLLSMLSQWESSQGLVTQEVSALSPKDILPSNLQFSSTEIFVASVNPSVQWAINNLYTGSNFVPSWKTEFTNLGQSPEYISLQIGAALTLHSQAIGDVAPIGVHELRAYLMFFDIETQDGGLYAQDLSDYKTWLSQNPNSTSDAKLNSILSLRLRHVQSQYVTDVQSRKLAIINGSGMVHGAARNLEREYCFDRLSPYR